MKGNSESIVGVQSSFSYTLCRDTAISPRVGISLSYTPCRDTAISPRGGISLSYTQCRDTAISPRGGISLSYTPCRDTAITPWVGYLFLTHHAGILLSHPGWDISFLHTMPGYCYLTPGLDIYISPLSRLRQCNYFFMTTTTTTKVQLNELPQTTIIFRIIEGTIRFNNAKIQTHALGSICVRCYGI